MHGTLVTKMLLSGLVGLLLALTADARFGNSFNLQSCPETKQCLLFDVICQSDDFEIRYYGPVTFISTDVMANSVSEALQSALPQLHEYFNGTNENGTQIDMALPISMLVPHNLTQQFRVRALLPAEYQEFPPSPTDDRVYIFNMTAFNAYVVSYHGVLTNSAERENAVTLSEDLDSVHATYIKDFHISTAYSRQLPTLEPTNNEVLYVVQGEPMCIVSEEL